MGERERTARKRQGVYGLLPICNAPHRVLCCGRLLTAYFDADAPAVRTIAFWFCCLPLEGVPGACLGRALGVPLGVPLGVLLGLCVHVDGQAD